MAEKFKEVFGFFPDKRLNEEVCDIVNCEGIDCPDCQYLKLNSDDNVTWGDKYEEKYAGSIHNKNL